MVSTSSTVSVVTMASASDPDFEPLPEVFDIDALRTVANGVNQMRSPDRAMLVITHYQRLLDQALSVKADFYRGGSTLDSLLQSVSQTS